VKRPKRTALADALAMLTRRDYSHDGLAAKLAGKGHSPADVEGALRQCAEHGYLDDRRFGHGRLQARLRQRPAGRVDALRDLRRQGLTETMAEAVAEEVFGEHGGEAAVLDDAFERWVARHGEPEDLAAAKRCFDHLMRRSFPRYLVLQKLSLWLD
jgi:SOS response regulatory protein OraA/RecX